MTCGEFRTRIEEAGSGGDERLRTHAQACRSCAAEARGVRQTREALAAWTDAEPPAGLARRALALCESEPRRALPPDRGLLALPAAAAFVTAGLALFIWISAGLSRTAPPVSPVSLAQPRDEVIAMRALRKVGLRLAWAEEKSRGALERLGKRALFMRGVER